jgi:thymidylate kinase
MLTEAGKKTKRIYAFEGIGGSGKSHIQELVAEQLKAQGIGVESHKVAGLGNSARVKRLSEIKTHRHELAVKGELTTKQVTDNKKDKIFRLAMRHQAQLFLRFMENNEFDIAILDRTPLMCWVFAAAHDSDNPFLDEIFNEALAITQSLALSAVFLFDVRPVTSYARALSRYCQSMVEVEKELERINNKRQLSDEQKAEILELTAKQMTQSVRKQQAESWDILPMAALEKERTLHQQALEKAAKLLQFSLIKVDAEQPINTVVAAVINDLKSMPDIKIKTEL